jgi:hypothetical protein
VRTDDVEPIASNVSVEHQHMSQVIHTTNNPRRQDVQIISFPSNDCIKYEFKNPQEPEAGKNKGAGERI